MASEMNEKVAYVKTRRKNVGMNAIGRAVKSKSRQRNGGVHGIGSYSRKVLGTRYGLLTSRGRRLR